MMNVVGHYKRFVIHQDCYKKRPNGTPEGDAEMLKVVVFGTNEKLDIKQQVVDVLHETCETKPTLAVVYKTHPRESAAHIPDLKRGANLSIYLEQRHGKEIIYPLLHWSDIVIVFASTVGLEARWLGRRVITVEPWSQSYLYFVDGDSVIHTRNIGDFRAAFEKLMSNPLNRPLTEVSRNEKPMSQRYAESIVDLVSSCKRRPECP
jgi:predicted glycosyltransferase